MAAGGAPPPNPMPLSVQSARESRWFGQGYADITKLREVAAKHERIGTTFQRRQARVLTRIEKLRHHSTLLREKAETTRGRIPEIQQEIAQNDRAIQVVTERTKGILTTSDATDLTYRTQKLRQKIADLQDKAQRYDHRAAIKTQKAAELMVRANQYLERSRMESQEAFAYRERADRLQAATDNVMTATSPGPAGIGSAPDNRRQA
jgi:chromosome segregation ATPase